MAFAQDVNETSKQSRLSTERFPVFPNCENFEAAALENCFYNQIQDFIFQNFECRVSQNFFGNIF